MKAIIAILSLTLSVRSTVGGQQPTQPAQPPEELALRACIGMANRRLRVS